MSRSGYIDDDCEQWDLIRWRGAVNSAIKGARGQAFLAEILSAMDAMPEKKLIAHDLEKDGAVCAIGSVGKARGYDMTEIDPEDHEVVAARFGIAHALACEIMYMNDKATVHSETPEQRFERVRRWIKDEIWRARGCVPDPFGHRALRMSRRLDWRCVIEWNEV
jgi:hypothetical protein